MNANYDPQEVSASRRQVAYATKLLLSSALPVDKANERFEWLRGPGFKATREVSELIDWAQGIIDIQQARKKASAHRKATYYNEKG